VQGSFVRLAVCLTDAFTCKWIPGSGFTIDMMISLFQLLLRS
jgi:hypothetical protein